MKMRVYLCAWRDRPSHRNLVATLGQKCWEEYDLELFLCEHGESPVSLKGTAISASEHFIPGHPDKEYRYSWIYRHAFQECLDDKLDVVGIMDDDALVKDPGELFKFACEAHALGAGAFGPINSWRVWTHYNNDYEAAHMGEATYGQWSTNGLQMYSHNFVEATEDIWPDMLQNMWFRCDSPLFMMANSLGMTGREFFLPGYAHPGSTGMKKFADEDFWKRSVRQIVTDYRTIQQVFVKMGIYERYMNVITRLHNNDLKTVLKKIDKGGAFTSRWKCRPHSDPNTLEGYAKENGIV